MIICFNRLWIFLLLLFLLCRLKLIFHSWVLLKRIFSTIILHLLHFLYDFLFVLDALFFLKSTQYYFWLPDYLTKLCTSQTFQSITYMRLVLKAEFCYLSEMRMAVLPSLPFLCAFSVLEQLQFTGFAIWNIGIILANEIDKSHQLLQCSINSYSNRKHQYTCGQSLWLLAIFPVSLVFLLMKLMTCVFVEGIMLIFLLTMCVCVSAQVYSHDLK